MKFDIVVGNPPYNSDSKAKKKPWPKFVMRALDLARSDILFVTPSSWAYGEKRETTAVRNSLRANLKWVDLSASSYFPGVGDDISVWHWSKCHDGPSLVYTREGEQLMHNFSSRFVAEKDKLFLCIEKKVLSVSPKLKLSKFNIEKKRLSPAPLAYRVQYSASQTLYMNDQPPDYFIPKVFINRSGHYWTSKNPEKYIRYMSEGVAGSLGYHIIVSNELEGKNLIRILHSKLFIFLMQFNSTKNTQFKDDIQRLPSLDISRSWSDDELYRYFKLTNEEIEHVESTVK